MEQLFYKEIPSPVGKLKIVATDDAITAILWEWEEPNRVNLGPMKENKDHPILKEAEKQLKEYFAGKRKQFSLPLFPCGTPFQRKVWEATQLIPYGSCISYADLAKKIGRPQSARPVGTALGKNPISIVVPCHRVIGKDGKLAGFAAGLPSKEILLNLEKGV